MKRLPLTLLVFVFAAGMAHAATDPARQAAAQRGTEPPANGVWYVYDRNGALLKEENYQSFRLHGEVRTFYPSGAVKEWLNYVDGYRHGASKTFYANGSLESESNYENNNLTGYTRRYYDTAELLSVSFYKKGNLDGEQKTYFKTGALRRISNYNDGILNGAVVTYNETGQIISQERYRKGVLIGRHNAEDDNLTSLPVQTPRNDKSLKKETKASAPPTPTLPKSLSPKESMTTPSTQP